MRLPPLPRRRIIPIKSDLRLHVEAALLWRNAKIVLKCFAYDVERAISFFPALSVAARTRIGQ
jgi:hypothetical protein